MLLSICAWTVAALVSAANCPAHIPAMNTTTDTTTANSDTSMLLSFMVSLQRKAPAFDGASRLRRGAIRIESGCSGRLPDHERVYHTSRPKETKALEILLPTKADGAHLLVRSV